MNIPITVSAPASVMLMGEHAVLFGHRAIVCALSQRIHVHLTPRDDKLVTITSALGCYENDLSAILTLSDLPREFSFVLASIAAVKPNQGFDLQIESEFSHMLGLGSSASVTASCVYALLLLRDSVVSFESVFDIGYRVIQTVQGRGSGSDLVASVYGGMVGYTVAPRNITPLLPHSTNSLPSFDLFYCGYKTPTPDVLRIIAEKSKYFPELYASIYQQMHAVSREAENTIIEQNWAKLGQLMNIYHGLMDALGVSDENLSNLVYREREKDNVLGAKISGSGLGDCIISLSKPNNHQPNSDESHINATLEAQGLIHHE